MGKVLEGLLKIGLIFCQFVFFVYLCAQNLYITGENYKIINMNKHLLFIIALLCMVAQGAWADGTSTFGGGDGSAKTPYIISTAAHWDQFASDVNGGTNYSGKYFLLGADISVTTMAGAGTTGKNAKPFSGTFNGGGHTLTFTHTATEAEGDIAPFRFIRNATICNLHVAGEITTAYKHAGGLAGRTYGTSLIQNCRVSTVIKSSVSGDATHGGIVAMKPDWSSAHLTIEGCVFDGKILTTGSSASTDCAGFVGYTSYGSLTIRNSIYAPAAPAQGETTVSSDKTFYRYNGNHSGTITLDKCYYTQAIGSGDPQGKQALSIGFPAEVAINVVPKGNATEYSVSGITVYEGNPSMKYDGTVYAGSGDVVELTFNNNYVGCTVTGYGVAEGGAVLNGNLTNGYTLEMGSVDVVIGFSMTGPALLQLEGEGTSASPYIISGSSVWDYIVSLLNYMTPEGKAAYPAYASAYYKLTTNITVETMMGHERNKFSGHFDGNGYTLTVNYDTDEQYAAPFRYVDGAEISNLVVAGSITTSKKFAAGIVANAKGNTRITNCRSSVTINSSVIGEGSHGGFVAYNEGSLTITGSAFDGYMLGGSTESCAGFVGWNETEGGANGTVSITNSLFAPTSTQMVIEKVFVRSSSYDGNVISITNSHCTAHYNVDQQSRIYSITEGENVSIAYSSDSNPTSYKVSGITFCTVGLIFKDVLYAKENDELTLTLNHSGTAPSGYAFSSFASTAGTLIHGEGSTYTFTMGNASATIYATYNVIPSEWAIGGDGLSKETAYTISTSTQWDEFVNKVNTGMMNEYNAPFATAYFKLTANITVTTMVGTENYKFKGHFDGGGNTLTLSYGSEQTPFSEDYCAPFRYIEGADIHDLTVDGTIYTQKQFAAGIAGYALNNNAITDCRSSVTINSSVSGDGTHGGFVANCQNNADDGTNVTFTRCAFDGKLLGATTDNCGGFVGWTAGNDWAGVKFKDCIFKPMEVSVQSDGSATFSRGLIGNTDHITVENSYYIQRLGAMQGEMAYTTPPTDVTTEAMTIVGITVYVKKTVVNNLAASGITPTTATVSWTGTDACSNYQVRYRKKQDASYSTSFDNGLPDGWTKFDIDVDEHNWTYEDGTKKGMAHSGNGSMYSASYINNYGPLEPDNWLVSPLLTLGGTMKVWLKGQDGDDFREHFAIYLSTEGGSKSNFIDNDGNLQSGVVTLVPETETTNEYQEYTANLSTYGEQGYIAIRHFNCYNQFYLVLDDFSVSNANEGEWTTVSGASSAGTTLTGLNDGTTYEYQIGFDYGGRTFYTSTATLTTLAADVAPTDLTATSNSATTATISWKGFGDRYNLRYYQGGLAKVTLSVPSDVWGDGSGYQMLIDKDHDTYGDVIPATGGLTDSGDASADTYANFEYKIPENADGALNTGNVVNGTNVTELTITIPAGIYDWCITNPSPDDRVWIASGNGNVGGRQNDFTFEAGKHYTFTVTFDDGTSNDCVNMTVEDDIELAQGDMTEIKGITDMSYALSGLTASTHYTIYVQSVKGTKTSDWSSVNFITLGEEELYLYDNLDNSGIISNTAYQVGTWKVTLQGRTLYKDGSWNTLCLPFNVTISGSPLEGATIKELDVVTEYGVHKTGFDDSDGTLYLYFRDADATEIEAGKPYIVKWGNAENIVNPVFNNVTMVNSPKTDRTITSADGRVSFVGNFAPNIINEGGDKTILYLGNGNKLYYPSGTKTINPFRAYFQLNGIEAGVPDTNNGGVRAFSLHFGDEETITGIVGIEHGTLNMEHSADAGWYDLSGRKLAMKPTAKGIYIYNGKKRLIK